MTKASTCYYFRNVKKKSKVISKFDIFLLFILIFLLIILSFNVSMDKYKNLEEKISLSPTTTEDNLNQKSNNVNNVKNKERINKNFDFSSWNSTCDWNVLIVNGANCIPEDYKVNTVTYDGLKVDSRIYKPLDSMFRAAKNDGINLTLSSAYRDNELQEILFEREVKEYTDSGYSQSVAENLAKKSVAFPGTSEHATGLAIDLNGVTDDFKYTDEYEWLCNNAYKYGFIQRYSEDKQEITGIISEPWHYRYVGVENAKEIINGNYCLEEYVYNLMN